MKIEDIAIDGSFHFKVESLRLKLAILRFRISKYFLGTNQVTKMPTMNYTITKDNLHIEDSWKVSKREMGVILAHIRLSDPTPTKVWNRSDFSLRMEWCVHNFLYSLGLWRSHTKDVDLNADCKIEWLYKIVGCLVWVFIK